MARITLDQIQQQLSEDHWTLLSQEYKNLDSELIVTCPEGHKVYTTWNKLRTKRECPVCKQNKYKENKPLIRDKKRGENRILALDQATKITGFSIFDGTELVHYGVFESIGESETERIHKIREWLVSMVENYHPDLIGLEQTQYQQNVGVTTFQTLCHLQGVLMDLCYELHIPFMLCNTNTWRAHCGVKGQTRNDKKKSMQLLVKQWFDITVTDDIADAIGIGKYAADGHKKKTEVVSWE